MKQARESLATALQKGNAEMTRLTSMEVWHQIQDEGLLTKMQREALFFICRHGPITGSELDAITKSKCMHQRISELFEAGVVRQAGRKKCSVTSRSVMAWESTGTMPTKTLKAIGSKRRKDAIKELKEKVEQQKVTIFQLHRQLKAKQENIEILVRELNRQQSLF